jgi:hypothetical protein
MGQSPGTWTESVIEPGLTAGNVAAYQGVLDEVGSWS